MLKNDRVDSKGFYEWILFTIENYKKDFIETLEEEILNIKVTHKS